MLLFAKLPLLAASAVEFGCKCGMPRYALFAWVLGPPSIEI